MLYINKPLEFKNSFDQSIQFFINFRLCSLSVQCYIIFKNIGGLFTGEKKRKT